MSFKDAMDRLNKKSLSTFGEEAVYSGTGMSDTTLQVIFDNNFTAIDPQTGMEVMTTQPMIGIKLDDLPREPFRGDTISLNGISYKITEYHPDSEGMAKLLLHRG